MAEGTEDGIPDSGNRSVTDVANLLVVGKEQNGRFGQEMCVADLNYDGRNDLIVSAPTVGSDTLRFNVIKLHS